MQSLCVFIIRATTTENNVQYWFKYFLFPIFVYKSYFFVLFFFFLFSLRSHNLHSRRFLSAPPHTRFNTSSGPMRDLYILGIETSAIWEKLHLPYIYTFVGCSLY